MSTVNVDIGPIKVTNSDGTDFMLFKGITYTNVPREFLPVMEKSFLSMLGEWTQSDADKQAGKAPK